ncbi:acetylpolyamine aminohydrolase [Pyrrhoderma noxium]|uniref:Acetylpolyamine aminohydrolase n=1 Tax=Pyrrhoderma noxium TaxID=2282107 RepID=A0A286USL1_9AGAM|nr:acetylpolyamine aminohydrolase [Pyrrhoderma noxium]
MKVFYHLDCLLHNPPTEILDGKPVPYLESPSRITIIKSTLQEEPSYFDITDKLDDDLDLKKWVLTVHENAYLDYLEKGYDDWIADGGDETGIFPETFPHISLLRRGNLIPENLSSIAKAGLYCFDLSSPITRTTFQSIMASLRVTLTSANHVQNNQESAFALCRPPGHHSMPSLCGGYCFLNNVAIATRFLQGQINCNTKTKIAILDIDYHHGNGTQEIFYEDPSVLYVSIHANNDYPYFTGAAKEEGEKEGKGFNHNFPLPRVSTGDDAYCKTLTRAVGIIMNFNPSYLVVSLGVDTHAEDPICEFNLSTEGYIQIGRIISTTRRPTLFVLEGGYHLESLGHNVRNVLYGFQHS